MKLTELQERLRRARPYLENNGVQIMAEVVGKRSVELINFQRVQLRKGKARDGGYLPRYRDDPFFKTLAQAIAYENWKSKWADPEKPKEVMDFYINGFYYSSLKLFIQGNKFSIDSNADFASSVELKADGVGLNNEYKMKFMKEYGRFDTLLILSDLTGLKRV